MTASILTSVQKLTITSGSVTIGSLLVTHYDDNWSSGLQQMEMRNENNLGLVAQGKASYMLSFTVMEKSDWSNIPDALLHQSLNLGASITLLFEGQTPDTFAGDNGFRYDGGGKKLYNNAYCSNASMSYNNLTKDHTYTFFTTSVPILIAPQAV